MNLVGSETKREKIGQGFTEKQPIEAGDMDAKLGGIVRKFADCLQAHSARQAAIDGNEGNLSDQALIVCDHRGNRVAFGANSQSVTDVFNVAALEYFAGSRLNSNADKVAAVRCVGAQPYLLRNLDQFVDRPHGHSLTYVDAFAKGPGKVTSYCATGTAWRGSFVTLNVTMTGTMGESAPYRKLTGTLARPMLFGRRNQREAFERQAEKVFPSIVGTALRLTRSREEAEDLAMEAMVRAYEAFDRFDGNNFKAWMLRIVTNLYINRYRQKQRGPQLGSLEEDGVLEPMGSEEEIPDRILFDNIVGSEVENALAQVPEDFRTAVILSDIEGLSYQEIADATNVPIGTVRSRIARGRSLLRRLLIEFAMKEGFIKNGAEE